MFVGVRAGQRRPSSSEIPSVRGWADTTPAADLVDEIVALLLLPLIRARGANREGPVLDRDIDVVRVVARELSVDDQVIRAHRDVDRQAGAIEPAGPADRTDEA